MLVGADQYPAQRQRLTVLAMGLFLVSFVAYATDVVAVSGGVVWAPAHAVALGLLAGYAIGVGRGGLLFAWLVTYASLLGHFGYSAAIQGADGSPFDRLGALVRFDALVFYGVEAVVFGTVAFALGTVSGWGYRAVVD